MYALPICNNRPVVTIWNGCTLVFAVEIKKSRAKICDKLLLAVACERVATYSTHNLRCNGRKGLQYEYGPHVGRWSAPSGHGVTLGPDVVVNWG